MFELDPINITAFPLTGRFTSQEIQDIYTPQTHFFLLFHTLFLDSWSALQQTLATEVKTSSMPTPPMGYKLYGYNTSYLKWYSGYHLLLFIQLWSKYLRVNDSFHSAFAGILENWAFLHTKSTVFCREISKGKQEDKVMSFCATKTKVLCSYWSDPYTCSDSPNRGISKTKQEHKIQWSRNYRHAWRLQLQKPWHLFFTEAYHCTEKQKQYSFLLHKTEIQQNHWYF